MLLLGIDFETTGVDSEKARPTEVGVCLYDTQKQEIVEEYASFIYRDSYEPLSEDVINVTGITDEMLKKDGKPWEEVLQAIHHYMDQVDYVVAHHAEYDRNIYGLETIRLKRNEGLDIKPRVKKWLCTMKDIKWPPKHRCKQLSHMALDAGMKLDNWVFHRACDDVKLMFALVEHSENTWTSIINYFNLPKIVIQAQVPSPFGKSGDGGVGKDIAKSLNYAWCGTWNRIEYKMMWTKQIPLEELDDEKRALFVASPNQEKTYKVRQLTIVQGDNNDRQEDDCPGSNRQEDPNYKEV